MRFSFDALGMSFFLIFKLYYFLYHTQKVHIKSGNRLMMKNFSLLHSTLASYVKYKFFAL